MVTQYAFITTAWFQFVPLLPLKQLNSSWFELFFKSRTILPHHLLLAQFAYFPKISLCHTFPRILPFFYKHHCVSLINQTRPSVLIDIFFSSLLPFSLLFLTLPPLTASAAVEWGVLSASCMSVTGQHIRRSLVRLGCVGAEMGSRGLEEVKSRRRDRWRRGDKHERSNKRRGGPGRRKQKMVAQSSREKGGDVGMKRWDGRFTERK